jgi:tRNA-dihydrouridine synthase B
MELIRGRFGDDRAAVLMRKYACCYAQGEHGARDFRKHVARIESLAEFHEVVDRYFPQ